MKKLSNIGKVRIFSRPFQPLLLYFPHLSHYILLALMLSQVARTGVSTARQTALRSSSFGLMNQQRGCAFWPFAWPKLSGSPTFYHTTWDRDFDPYVEEDNNPEIPRNEYGVPAHIPPEIGQSIKHAVCIPYVSPLSTLSAVPCSTTILPLPKEVG